MFFVAKGKSRPNDASRARELRQSHTATHGIGVIQLDSEIPTESQILIPARERPGIDWDMCNRLTEENLDFVSYIERVKHFYQTSKVNKAEWRLGDSI